MSAATVLTSAMAGMPVLNGTEGSLSALIRYIAPMLGWSIEFDNGPVIVIKPQSYRSGQALFYRIDDRAARGGLAPRTAEVKAYESMSDINTGSGLVGTTYIQKSYTANTTANAYSIIGDEYGFYLNTCRAYSSATPTNADMLAYIGFAESIYDEIPICVLLGQSDTTTLSASYAVACAVARVVGAVSTPNCFLHKNRSGTLAVAAALVVNGGPHTGDKSFAFIDNAMPSYDDEFMYASPYLNDGAAYTCRAMLPGLYYPCHLYADLLPINSSHNAVINAPFIVDDKAFLTILCGSQTVQTGYAWGVALIDVSQGFRE